MTPLYFKATKLPPLDCGTLAIPSSPVAVAHEASGSIGTAMPTDLLGVD
jgi:hypothetical protein